MQIAIVGLGFVGLTLAAALSQQGVEVVGIEKNDDTVDTVNKGNAHFHEIGLNDRVSDSVSRGLLKATSSYKDASTCSVFIITVGTPLGANGVARLDMIEQAATSIAEVMPEDALIMLRSTVKVGTARNVILPILESSGKKFSIAMCPERTLEGKAFEELSTLPQIIAADTKEVRERAGMVFKIITTEIVEVTSLEAGELAKLVNNTYRDVQFGFANEIARICDFVKVDAYEVIHAANHNYARSNIALPGLVGGPCLEKDGHILAQGLDIGLDIIPAVRKVNERQPFETASFIASKLEGIKNPRICFLGVAFKGVPETDDMRGAMSIRVLQGLKNDVPDAEFVAYDKLASHKELEALGWKPYANLSDATKGAHVVVITNNHGIFKHTPLSEIIANVADGAFVYDYWNNYKHLTLQEKHKNRYMALGAVGI